MPVRMPDNAKESVSGTTTLTLGGATSRYFRSLTDAGIADGDRFPARVAHRTVDEWQTGWYRRSGDTIVLEEFRASSTGAEITTWAAGTKDVATVPLGSDGVVETWASAGLDPWSDDNSAAIIAAYARLKVIDLGGRTFRVTQSLPYTFAAPDEGDEEQHTVGFINGTIDASAVTGDNVAIVDLQGPAFGAEVVITEPVGVGTDYTTSAPVDDASGLAAGDLVAILCDEKFANVSFRTGVRSEYKFIESIAGNVVTFRGPLETKYVTNPRLQKLQRNIHPCFRNLKVIGNPAYSQYGIRLRRFHNPTWWGIEFENCFNRGLGVQNCVQGGGGDLRINRTRNPGLGYGLSLGGCQWINHIGILADRTRHAVTTGSGEDNIISRRCMVGVIQRTGGSDAAADIHADSSDIVYFGIVANSTELGSGGDAVTCQAPNCTILGVTVSGFPVNGVVLQYQGGKDEGRPVSFIVGDVNIANHDISGIGDETQYTVWIQNISESADLPIDDFTLYNVVGNSGRGVRVSATEGPIRGGTLSNVKSTVTGSSGSGGGFYVDQNGPYELGDLDFINCRGIVPEGTSIQPFRFDARETAAATGKAWLFNPVARNGDYAVRSIGMDVQIVGIERFSGQSTGRIRLTNNALSGLNVQEPGDGPGAVSNNWYPATAAVPTDRTMASSDVIYATPFYLERPTVLSALGLSIGATVGADGAVAMAIYGSGESRPFALLATTIAAPVNVAAVDIALPFIEDVTLPAGNYWIAVALAWSSAFSAYSIPATSMVPSGKMGGATIAAALVTGQSQGQKATCVFDTTVVPANEVLNPTFTDAAAGTPGTAPTGMTWTGTANNVTREIIGTGTEAGIDYVEVKYSGTPNADGSVSLRFEASTDVDGVQGERFVGSFYLRLVASGTGLTNVSAMSTAIQERDSGGTQIASNSVAFTPTDAALNTQNWTNIYVLQNASTAHVTHSLTFDYDNGMAIDITFRVGLPYLAKLSDANVPRLPDIWSTSPFAAVSSPPIVVVDGGTGYAVGDTLTMDGGVFSAATQVEVDTISGGGLTGPIATCSVSVAGSYTQLPALPMSQSSTSGAGTGALLNIQYQGAAAADTTEAIPAGAWKAA